MARMLRAPGGSSWALVVLSASACSSRSTEFGALPPLDVADGVGFILALSADGTRVQGPPLPLDLGVDGGPPLNLEWDEDTRLVLLALDDAKLSEFGIGRADRPATEYAVSSSPESCERGSVSDEDGRARLRIAALRSSRLFELGEASLRFDEIEPGSATALASLSVELPEPESRCSGSKPPSARPFDPTATALFPDGATVRGRSVRERAQVVPEFQPQRLEVLTEDRIILVSATELFDFQRGRSYRDESGHRLSPSEITGLPPSPISPPLGWHWSQIAKLPCADAGRTCLVALLLEITPTDVPISRSALVTLELDAAGFLSAETSTVPTGALRQLLVEADGAVLALGQRFEEGLGSSRRAVLLAADRPEGPWRRHVFDGLQAGSTLVASGEPARPHLAGFEDSLFLRGDLRRAPDEAQALRLEEDAPRRGRIDKIAVASEPSGRVFWASGNDGGLHRGRVLGEIAERVYLNLPLEAQACSGRRDACGWPEPTAQFTGLEFINQDQRFAGTLQDCAKVMVFRVSDLCPIILPISESPATSGELPRREFQRFGSQVYVSDRSGEIYVFDAE